MAYNSFEEMPVWQKATELAVRIFKLTENLPGKENVILIEDIWKYCRISPILTELEAINPGV